MDHSISFFFQNKITIMELNSIPKQLYFRENSIFNNKKKIIHYGVNLSFILL